MNRIKSHLLLYLLPLMSIGSLSSQSQKVLFDHDGGIDDLLSLLILTQIPDVEIVGVCVTPADCFIEDATESTLKILNLTGNESVPVAKGIVRPVNPFPKEWRAQPMVVNAFPRMLLTQENDQQISNLPAHAFIEQQLDAATDPVTVLITGPCSNLTGALESNPALKTKIKEVVWMGGAVDVGGNVATYHHNTSAEWNAYWDPAATKTLFSFGLDIQLIPLDVTNQVPVNKPFLQRLAQHFDNPLADLASQFWATTLNTIPGYEYTYFMWDVLATSYLGIPQAFTSESIELAVKTDTPEAGRTVRSPGSQQWIKVAKQVDVDQFYDYIIGLLAK